jgi:hypothetical protein
VDARSHIVRGAILSLEKYRDVSGYLPIFMVSVSGSPERIKELARNTLPVILEDPSELLTAQVIRSSSYAPPVKFVALRTIEGANSPVASKAMAAVAALSEGWRAATNDARQRVEIARMRKTSIDMINRYKPADSAIYPLLERSYREGSDDDEKLAAIRTLGALATEDSARQLSSFTLTIISRIQSSASNRTDEIMLRELIPALAATRQSVARSALQAVVDGPTTPAVKLLARDALNR